MNIWDVGGFYVQRHQYYEHYYPEVNVLVYVLDVKTLHIGEQS